MFALNERMLRNIMDVFEFSESNGYDYNMVHNPLGLPEKYFANGITLIDARGLLRLEYIALYDAIVKVYPWFSNVDHVTAFAVVSIAKTINISALLKERAFMQCVKQGSFNLACEQLAGYNINKKLLTVLKLGKLA